MCVVRCRLCKRKKKLIKEILPFGLNVKELKKDENCCVEYNKSFSMEFNKKQTLNDGQVEDKNQTLKDDKEINKCENESLNNIQSQEMFCENKYNARSVWGKLVLELKCLNLITLHTACGEIRNVKFEKNTLIVEVKEEYLFKILTEEKNRQKIEELLKKIDEKIEVCFNKKNTNVDDGKENLNKLKSLFGKELSVK